MLKYILITILMPYKYHISDSNSTMQQNLFYIVMRFVRNEKVRGSTPLSSTEKWFSETKKQKK